MTSFLPTMQKTVQDTAKTIIQQHLRRSTSGNNSLSSPLKSQAQNFCIVPNQGPLSLQNYSGQKSRQSSVENQPMNTEELYRNLRMLIKKDDSCNGSKSQSATTTESNTPENTVRLDTIDANHKTLIISLIFDCEQFG